MTRPTRQSLNDQIQHLVAENQALKKHVGLPIDCDSCGTRLRIPGGVVLSPPNRHGACQKFHVCSGCWGLILHVVKKR